jgi:hypothetical protein
VGFGESFRFRKPQPPWTLLIGIADSLIITAFSKQCQQTPQQIRLIICLIECVDAVKMSTVLETSIPNIEQEPQLETRPRKRRRRTVACTQCRNRKLKCDREYPTCSRCIKSGTPARCTYEDGFLWQQPKTVVSSGLTDRFSSRITVNPTTSASSPDSAAAAPDPPPSNINNVSTAAPDSVRKGGAPRARFLDTVLDTPNSMTNRWPHTPEEQSYQQHDPAELGLASPSQQLDLPNRVIIRGKGTKTRFNGGGIIANLMLQVIHTSIGIVGVDG